MIIEYLIAVCGRISQTASHIPKENKHNIRGGRGSK